MSLRFFISSNNNSLEQSLADRLVLPRPPICLSITYLCRLRPLPPPTAAIPVFYPQPAAVVDPNWYYNHMVLYPLSPGAGYIPAQYSPVVQSPVVPVYGSHQVLGGQVPTCRSGGMGVRMPVATSGSVMEHVTSPVGGNGGMVDTTSTSATYWSSCE